MDRLDAKKIHMSRGVPLGLLDSILVRIFSGPGSIPTEEKYLKICPPPSNGLLDQFITLQNIEKLAL